MQPLRLQERLQARPRSHADARSRWGVRAELLQREALVVWFLLRSSNTPWIARIIAGCIAAYVLSPVQLIPSFVPVIGFADDFAVMALGMSLIRAVTPKPVMEQARRRAERAIGRGENIRAYAVRATTMAVAGVCLALSVVMFVILFGR
jgi:uncharacterized membrane protein YkvA (DUF1232 family)